MRPSEQARKRNRLERRVALVDVALYLDSMGQGLLEMRDRGTAASMLDCGRNDESAARIEARDDYGAWVEKAVHEALGMHGTAEQVSWIVGGML